MTTTSPTQLLPSAAMPGLGALQGYLGLSSFSFARKLRAVPHPHFFPQTPGEGGTPVVWRVGWEPTPAPFWEEQTTPCFMSPLLAPGWLALS